jgi:hypothetical protein
MIAIEPGTLGTELEADGAALVQSTIAPITTREELQAVVGLRQDLAARVKVVVEFFKPFKSQAHQLHQQLCDREGLLIAPLQQYDAACAAAIRDYKVITDRQREADERAAQEQARRDQQARAVADAAALEAQGQPALAAAIIEEALVTPAPVVVLPDPLKVKGLSFTRVWKWRPAGGTTPAHYARAVSVVLRQYLTLDTKKLDGYATSMKDTASIEGLEFYYEDRPNRR